MLNSLRVFIVEEIPQDDTQTLGANTPLLEAGLLDSFRS